MYKENWIQPCWCSVVHKAINSQLPGSKLAGSEAVLQHLWAHRASALETLVSQYRQLLLVWRSASLKKLINRAPLLDFPNVIRAN